MEKEFVPYVESLEIKELGFDKPCLGFYWNTGKFYTTAECSSSIETHKQNQLGDYDYDSTSAPTWKQAFKFFREKFGLHAWISSKTVNDGKTIFIPNGRTIPDTIKKNLVVDIIPYMAFEKEETAELECIRQLIKIAKEKK